MRYDDPVEIEDEEGESQLVDRRAVLEPAIRNVVSALGGVESGVYRLGDECYGCLKDLKKIWRKDDTDDDRTVARIFYEVRLLANDLIPILLATAGAGDPEDKRAIATADIMCAMTWPIDLAEELKELDEDLDARADFTQLLRSHLDYKRALLKPGVLQSLFSLTLPCLGRDVDADRAQKERDAQVIHLVLHVVRNLAFVKDPPVDAHASAEANQMSMLQGRLIRVLEEAHFFDLLVTIAANATADARFNAWNVTVLEILYLLSRGVKAEELAVPPAKQASHKLQALLALEDQQRRESLRNASSRHSRFGTLVAVSIKPKGRPNGDEAGTSAFGARGDEKTSLLVHRQRAIKQAAGDMLDLSSGKRSKAGRVKKTDEVSGREDQLGLEARRALRGFVAEILRVGFNPLLASLLNDIKSERAKIAEKDHLRLLHVTKWFLTFFRLVKAATGEGHIDVSFGMVAEITERGWIAWVLKRMREAVDTKPKSWNELQTGLECLTELILLIESMSLAAATASGDSEADSLAEMADLLQQQLVYNGEVLEIALESLRAYREGTQALAYLDAAVHLSWALLRMLEKWTKGESGKEMVVRKRAKARRKKKTTSTEEGEGVVDVNEEEELAEMEANREREDDMREALFTFEAFELRFANADVTNTLLIYLGRYKEFGTAHEKMKRVVALMHRQAVRAKAEGLFFKVSALDLFKHILADSKSLPKDQAYKDLLALVNFILRKFFKAAEQEPFLLMEAFFPKNRGQWKAFSSLTPEELAMKTGKASGVEKTTVDHRFPQDVQVKKGYSWSEQVGIAVKALVEDEKKELVEWTQDLLLRVHTSRQQLVDDTDGASSREPPATPDDVDEPPDEDADAEAEAARLRQLNGPSQEAKDKFEDYLIPYTSDEQADAVTKNPQLKLLFKLLKFTILDQDADEFEWCIPKDILLEELQRSASIIGKFVEMPIDLQGKAAKEMLSKRPRRRRRRSPSPGLSDSDDAADWNGEGGAAVSGKDREERERRKAARKAKNARKDEKSTARKARQKKEAQVYKSAQFIEDSDADNDDAAFWERERLLRERMNAAASGNLPPAMKATGTRKRKKARESSGKERKKKRAGSVVAPDDPASDSAAGRAEDDALGSPSTRGSSEAPATPHSDVEDASDQATPPPTRSRPKPRPRPRPVRKTIAAASPASSRHSSVAPDTAAEAPSVPTTRRNRVVISDEED